MDATKEQKVKDAVNGLVTKGYMFTVYDVTKTLRNAGEVVKHDSVKNVVQAMFNNGEMGQYTREIVDVGAPVQPWVYYHPYSDVANYDQHWVENNPTQDGMKNDSDGTVGTTGGYTPLSSLGSVGTPATPATPSAFMHPPAGLSTPAPAAPSFAPAVKQGGRMLTISENRLQIPVKCVRVVGWTPHQAVYVYRNPASTPQELYLKASLAAGTLSPYLLSGQVVVNKNGGIRICKTILKKIANPPTATTYKVEANVADNEIVVKPV